MRLKASKPAKPFYPSAHSCRAMTFRASLDPARTYLQGGGYGSRQCRADTQLAMIEKCQYESYTLTHLCTRDRRGPRALAIREDVFEHAVA